RDPGDQCQGFNALNDIRDPRLMREGVQWISEMGGPFGSENHQGEQHDQHQKSRSQKICHGHPPEKTGGFLHPRKNPPGHDDRLQEREPDGGIRSGNNPPPSSAQDREEVFGVELSDQQQKGQRNHHDDNEEQHLAESAEDFGAQAIGADGDEQKQEVKRPQGRLRLQHHRLEHAHIIGDENPEMNRVKHISGPQQGSRIRSQDGQAHLYQGSPLMLLTQGKHHLGSKPTDQGGKEDGQPGALFGQSGDDDGNIQDGCSQDKEKHHGLGLDRSHQSIPCARCRCGRSHTSPPFNQSNKGRATGSINQIISWLKLGSGRSQNRSKTSTTSIPYSRAYPSRSRKGLGEGSILHSPMAMRINAMDRAIPYIVIFLSDFPCRCGAIARGFQYGISPAAKSGRSNVPSPFSSKMDDTEPTDSPIGNNPPETVGMSADSSGFRRSPHGQPAAPISGGRKSG